MGLVDDDSEPFVRQALFRQDRFHREGERLNRDNDDWRPVQQGLGKLLAFRFGAFLAVNGSDHAELMVNVLDGLLKLAVQNVPVGDDDDGIENGVTVVVAQADQVMGGPGDRGGLAGPGTMLAQVLLARARFQR